MNKQKYEQKQDRFSERYNLFNMWVVKQVQGHLTFSALKKSIYYNKYGNASVIFTRSAQGTKCIIASHSKN